MPKFIYKVKDDQGRVKTGTLDVASRKEAEQQLKAKGFTIQDLHPMPESKIGPGRVGQEAAPSNPNKSINASMVIPPLSLPSRSNPPSGKITSPVFLGRDPSAYDGPALPLESRPEPSPSPAAPEWPEQPSGPSTAAPPPPRAPLGEWPPRGPAPALSQVAPPAAEDWPPRPQAAPQPPALGEWPPRPQTPAPQPPAPARPGAPPALGEWPPRPQSSAPQPPAGWPALSGAPPAMVDSPPPSLGEWPPRSEAPAPSPRGLDAPLPPRVDLDQIPARTPDPPSGAFAPRVGPGAISSSSPIDLGAPPPKLELEPLKLDAARPPTPAFAPPPSPSPPSGAFARLELSRPPTPQAAPFPPAERPAPWLEEAESESETSPEPAPPLYPLEEEEEAVDTWSKVLPHSDHEAPAPSRRRAEDTDLDDRPPRRGKSVWLLLFLFVGLLAAGGGVVLYGREIVDWLDVRGYLQHAPTWLRPYLP